MGHGIILSMNRYKYLIPIVVSVWKAAINAGMEKVQALHFAVCNTLHDYGLHGREYTRVKAFILKVLD